MPPADLQRLNQLPRSTATWQIGAHRLPESADPDGGRWALICCEKASPARAVVVLTGSPVAEDWRQLFVCAALADTEQHRPTLPSRVDVVGAECFAALVDFRTLGVTLDAAADSLWWKCKTEVITELWLSDPVPSDIERPLWAAAGAIAQQAPWKWLDCDTKIKVTLPDGPFPQTVIGFAARRREEATVFVCGPTAPHDELFVVMMDRPRASLGQEDRAEPLGLPLVDGWLPGIVRIDGDANPRKPTVAELRSLAAILQGVAAFARARAADLQQGQPSRGTWPTLLGDVHVAFAPENLEEDALGDTFSVPHELALAVRAGGLPLLVAVVDPLDVVALEAQIRGITSVLVEDVEVEGQPGWRFLALHAAGGVTELGEVAHRPEAWLGVGADRVGIGWATSEGAVDARGLIDAALVVDVASVALAAGHT